MVKFAQFGIAIVLACGCAESADPNGREGGSDKHEWSILQVASSKSTGPVPSAGEVFVEGGYDLLSVPSIDGSTRIWIMLWPKSSPYYKQMPRGNYRISRAVLDDLVRANKVSATVQEALAGHLER